MHLAALTGLRFARSPSHFGGLADFTPVGFAGSGRVLADRIGFLLCGLSSKESKGKNKISSASQGRVFIPRPFFFYCAV